MLRLKECCGWLIGVWCMGLGALRPMLAPPPRASPLCLCAPMCAGADSLAHDRLGCFNMSPLCLVFALHVILCPCAPVRRG